MTEHPIYYPDLGDVLPQIIDDLAAGAKAVIAKRGCELDPDLDVVAYKLVCASGKPITGNHCHRKSDGTLLQLWTRI